MIPEDLTAGIVQILSYDGNVAGTGFLVPKNMVATCAHVIESADPGSDNKVTVRFPLNGKELSAVILSERWRSPDQEDLSILQLEDKIPENAKVLSLGSSAGVIGHKVCAFGFPDVGEVEGIWSRGEVSGKVTERGISLLQINSNEITEGFSGAPLWDDSRHRVIGIVVCIAETDSHGKLQNIAFAIPSETLISICPELKIEDVCPYRGLFSFKEDDEFLFFGRSKLLQELTEQLRTNPRFLALVGSSGSGKSSLVFAGLMPRIKRGEIVGFENAKVVTFRPNDVSKFDGAYESDPEESLRQSLNKSGINIEKADMWEGIRLFFETKPDIRLVIYADQFEILFANPNQAKQIKFMEGIYGLLRSKLKISLLLTIRGDYYDLLLNSLFGEYLSEGQVNIRSMSAEELREAIRKPAEVTGLEIETGLEDLMIKDLKNTKNPLPLLEFTLTQLWASKSDGLLTYENYTKIGGASGAIGQWANETFNGLSAEEKELSRKIFTRLIYYGEREMPDSRRRLPLEKLAGDDDEQAVRLLIKKLADAHILVTDCGPGKESETVEIIHDSLLIEWKQLNKWITEHRGFLTWRQRLEDKMDEWNKEKDEGNLLRGTSLAVAEGWIKKYKEEFNPQEIGYINASSELEEKERKEKERSRNRIIKGLTVFSIFILLLATFATSQWIRAEQESKEARAIYLSSESSILAQSPFYLEQNTLLAIESFRMHRTYIADELIRKGLSLLPICVKNFEHNYRVEQISFSPDGKYVTTVSCDITNNSLDGCRYVHMWNASTGESITIPNHEGKFKSISFSPDLKYIATLSPDNKASVCNTYTGEEIIAMSLYNDTYFQADFSPDGKYIAMSCISVMKDWTYTEIWNKSTGKEITNMTHAYGSLSFSPDGKYAVVSDYKTLHVYSTATGEKITDLNYNDRLSDAVFSPDGKYIAVSSINATRVWESTGIFNASTGIWNASTGKEITDMILAGVSVEFSPDGKYIATIEDKNAHLWNTSTGEKIADLSDNDRLDSVIFSPDGKYIATIGTKRVCTWDLNTKTRVSELNPGYDVGKVMFSPDGKNLVTNKCYYLTGSYQAVLLDISANYSYSTTSYTCYPAILWDVSTGEKIAVVFHHSLISDVTFSPDGKYLATASHDNTARLWNISSVITKLDNNESINKIAFSPPDGKYIAAISEDNTLGIWNTVTGKEITHVTQDDSLNDVVFSPDGKLIATASNDKTSRIWYAYTGKEIIILQHESGVCKVLFSPDGKYIVTASNDNKVCIWDAYTGKKIAVIKHYNWVHEVVFSPDGKYVATASYDKTARVFDASTGKEITNVTHDDGVNDVVFSPDGKFIATASNDKTTRVWDAYNGKEIMNMSHNSSVFSIVFSPDGKFLATSDGEVWDAYSGKKIYYLKYDYAIKKILYSPDGKYLATECNDLQMYAGIVNIYDASTGDKIAILNQNNHIINDVAFSPDGKYIATASNDNITRLWVLNTEDLINESSNRILRNLTNEECEKYSINEPYNNTFPNLP